MQSLNSVQNRKSEALVRINGEKGEPTSNKSATVMVGAVTAALGASALLAQHQVNSQPFSNFTFSFLLCILLSKN